MRILWADENNKTPASLRTACNYMCIHCADVFNSPQGIGAHLKVKHDETPEYKVNWKPTMYITYNETVMRKVTRYETKKLRI